MHTYDSLLLAFFSHNPLSMSTHRHLCHFYIAVVTLHWMHCDSFTQSSINRLMYLRLNISITVSTLVTYLCTSIILFVMAFLPRMELLSLRIYTSHIFIDLLPSCPPKRLYRFIFSKTPWVPVSLQPHQHAIPSVFKFCQSDRLFFPLQLYWDNRLLF